MNPKASMHSSTMYAPGTVFRFYASSAAEHYTGLFLKDGAVLQIKTPNGTSKTKYDSFETWRASIDPSYNVLKVDASKARGAPDGFDYPDSHHPVYTWLKWCMSITWEAAPQLLENQDYKQAYNVLAALNRKYKDCIDYHYLVGNRRYNTINLSPDPFATRVSARVCYFTNYSRSYRLTREITAIQTEITDAHKKLVEFLEPIRPYMERQFKIGELKKQIRAEEAGVRRKMRKMDQIQLKINAHKTAINMLTRTLEEASA